MVEHRLYPSIVELGEAPFSNVVMDENYAYLAGIVAADFPEGREVLGDVASETTAVMDAVQRLLLEVGLATSDIMRVDVHLLDLADMPVMNKAYAAFFPDGHYPARTCTQSGALFGGSLVEITCVAKRR